MSEGHRGQEGPNTVCAYVAPADGLTVDTQRRRIMAWSNRSRVEVVGACEDPNRSGRHRAGLRQALDLVQSGAVEGIVVAHPRVISADPIEQSAYAWAVLRGHGHFVAVDPVKVDNVTAIIVESDSQRRSWQHVMSTEARLRMRDEDSARYTGGMIPFGRRVESGRLVEDAREMAIVERIMELRGDGSPYAEIAGIMNAEGYDTPSGRGAWHPGTVQRIVQRYEQDDPNRPARSWE